MLKQGEAVMGIFSSIKNAIWGSDEDKAKPAAAPAAAPAAPKPAPAPAAPAAPAPPTPISEAEMAARIGAMPDADKYNWRTSIVDLMKLVGLDPSFANRKELAEELGMTDYGGTAEQNIALHHAVMNLLALEGGKVGGMLKD
jgi:3-oxoacyl-ACP reductase-like protein